MLRYVIGGEAKLILLLLAGLTIRVAAMVGSGHQGDITALARWAERVVSTGLGGYYSAGGDANYPAVLYLLWLLGTAFDGTSLLTAVRAISIPFDIILGATLYRAGWSLAGPHAGLLAAALYLLNPGAVLAGAFWGQLDALGTAAVVGSLIALASRRYGISGVLAVSAVLVKPQFGIAAVILLAVIVFRDDGVRRSEALARATLGGLAAYLAVTVPLGLAPADLVEIVSESSERMAFASLHGFNAWGLLFGFETDDGPLVYLGLALLAAGVMLSVSLLRMRRDIAGTFAVAALVALSIYFLPTRVHERYLFPVIALLTPLVAFQPKLLRPYVALSGAFSLSLLYALIRGRRSGAIEVPQRLEQLLDWPGVPLISLALMAAAAWCAMRLWPIFREAGRPDRSVQAVVRRYTDVRRSPDTR
ncbi:hypothetical protein BH20CHL5_BH20CHL5_05180 [soil metagenome]